MKSPYQQFRDILDAVQYPVDPQHEAAFRTILLNDRRRHNRNVFWFALVLLGVLIASYIAMSILMQGDEKVQTQIQTQTQTQIKIQPQTQTQGTPELQSHAGVLTNKESTSMELDLEQENAAMGNASHANSMNNQESETVRSVPLNQSVEQTKNKGDLSALKTGYDTKSASSKSPAGKNQGSESKESIPTSIVEINNQNTSSDGLQPVEITTGKSLVKAVPSEVSKQTTSGHNSTVAMEFSNEPLASTLTVLAYEGRNVKVECPIIPADRILPKHRLHYGVSGAWFPTDQLFTKNHIGTGYGFQIGGYASYRMSPRIQARADAGFSKIDGGFSYVKESTSQQFGFSVLNQEHRLEVDRLFSGYAGAEIGLRRGKNVFFIGLLGQFLYGAKGDIQNISYALDAQAPTIIHSEDVWLTTSDMSTISVHSTIGIRSRLARRVELGALVRIPISHTLRAQQNAAYTYQVISHSVTPQLMLSYQINQQ